MRVYVNDEDIEIEEGATVSSLLGKMALEARSGVAVAVNDEVISRSDWSRQSLAVGDRVLLIAPIQGG